MEEKERIMMEDMFFQLLEVNLNIDDRRTIDEYFLYKTLEILEIGEGIEDYVDFFERLESVALKHKDKFYTAFFYSLAQIISIKFRYTKYPKEIISKSSFLKAFDDIKRKYGW